MLPESDILEVRGFAIGRHDLNQKRSYSMKI